MNASFSNSLSETAESVRRAAARSPVYDWRQNQFGTGLMLQSEIETSIRHMRVLQMRQPAEVGSQVLPFALIRMISFRYKYWIKKEKLTPAEMDAIVGKLIAIFCPCIGKDHFGEMPSEPAVQEIPWKSKRSLRRYAVKQALREMEPRNDLS